MSTDRHLARILRLQHIHALLVRRQAGRLAEAEADVHRATERLARVEALLDATGSEVGPHTVGTLSGGAHLRSLLVRTMVAEQQRTALAKETRRQAARQQRVMDARAERIGAQVAAAHRTSEPGATAQPAGRRPLKLATLNTEESLP